MFRNRTTSWKKDIIIGKIEDSHAADLKGVKSAAGLEDARSGARQVGD